MISKLTGYVKLAPVEAAVLDRRRAVLSALGVLSGLLVPPFKKTAWDAEGAEEQCGR